MRERGGTPLMMAVLDGITDLGRTDFEPYFNKGDSQTLVHRAMSALS